MIYIGIDNGLSGAMVAISDVAGTAPIAMTVMPIRALGKGNEVDAAGVHEWLSGLGPWDQQCVLLETPGKFSPGVMALTSMWDSYGAIRSILECHNIRRHRIPPAQWQKVMLVGCATGNTKPFALSVARRLWPHETWLPSTRHRTAHDGLVDAALIAEYGRRKQL